MIRVALVFVLAALSSACSEELHYMCNRSSMVAHPTMTPEELNLGPDARVRQVSEGAKGGLGGGTTKSID